MRKYERLKKGAKLLISTHYEERPFLIQASIPLQNGVRQSLPMCACWTVHRRVTSLLSGAPGFLRLRDVSMAAGAGRGRGPCRRCVQSTNKCSFHCSPALHPQIQGATKRTSALFSRLNSRINSPCHSVLPELPEEQLPGPGRFGPRQGGVLLRELGGVHGDRAANPERHIEPAELLGVG